MGLGNTAPRAEDGGAGKVRMAGTLVGKCPLLFSFRTSPCPSRRGKKPNLAVPCLAEPGSPDSRAASRGSRAPARLVSAPQ